MRLRYIPLQLFRDRMKLATQKLKKQNKIQLTNLFIKVTLSKINPTITKDLLCVMCTLHFDKKAVYDTS